jgi:predicted ATPase
MNIVTWLRKLGLEAYQPTVRNNHTDFDVSKRLNGAELKEPGLIFLEDRTASLNAIPVQKGRPAKAPRAAERSPSNRLKRLDPSRPNGAKLRPLTLVRRSVKGPNPDRLTPFRGREEELRRLLRAWRLAAAGEGQVVLLSGEAGIGKSRIVRELSERLKGQRCTPLSHFCSPEHAESPLRAMIGLLERAAGSMPCDGPQARLVKLKALLAEGDDRPDEATHLIADLIGIGHTEGNSHLDLTPRRRRQRILEMLLEQFKALARRQTVLAVCEDLQWADPSTLELLDMMADRIQELPVLVVMTFRPEFAASWDRCAHAARLRLSPLDHGDCRAIIDHLSGGEPLAEDVTEEIIAMAEGVPLLIEEVTEAVLHTGSIAEQADQRSFADAVRSTAIPPIVHKSLMARLDALPHAKEVAQIGAVIGREFSHATLATIAGWPEDQLQHALDRLVASTIVFRYGTPPDAVYAFKHALIREAAYQSLPEGLRRSLHGSVALVLEERFPDLAAAEPERLANHYTAAGLLEPAVAYWLRAGQRAAARAAGSEAVAHLSKGLVVLDGLPDAPEHTLRRVDLLVALGRVLTVAKGHAAPEVEQAFGLAQTLCRKAGRSSRFSASTRRLFPAVRSLWDHYNTRANLDTARELAGQCQRLAADTQDPRLLSEAHFCLGVSSLLAGELAEARERLTRSIVLHDVKRQGHPPLDPEPRIVGLSHLAQASWLRGFPDQAVRASQEAVEMARAAGHPFSLAYALLFASWVAQFRRDAEATGALAADARACAAEEGFPSFLAMATILRGWASSREAQEQAPAATEMQEGLEHYRASGAEIARPYLLALLAEVHAAAGGAEHALAALAEGIEVAGATGERWYEAELRRREGALLLGQSIVNRRSASARFCQAIAVADQQGSKSLELRAAVSLARLWSDVGRRTQAHDLLAPICGWFTEGFDTADLKEAKQLLDELR